MFYHLISVLSLMATSAVAFSPIAIPGRIAVLGNTATRSVLVDSRLHYQNDTYEEVPQATGQVTEPVLERSKNFLTGSRLIYFLASFRELSYCGYTTTPFDKVSRISVKNPLSSFKLLEIIVQELDAIIRGQIKENGDKKDWQADAKLLQVLDYILNFDPKQLNGVEPETRRARDLDSLVKCVRKIKEDGTLKLRAKQLNKLAGIESDDPKRVFRASGFLDKGFQGKALEVRKMLNKTLSDVNVEGMVADLSSYAQLAFTTDKFLHADFADMSGPEWIEEQDEEVDKMVDLMSSLASESLNVDSVFPKAFTDDVELVYFDDRYQHKKCVYGITINRTDKTVCVVFRGSVNSNDWKKNLQIVQEDIPNPVKVADSSKSQPPNIGVHKGFYKFLCRERLDSTNGESRTRNKLIRDQIAEILEGLEKEDPDAKWRVCVTGHSLGGALSTLFAFYAAMDERLTKNGPISAYTFASPLVGDEDFRKAFKGLEENGKLVHARICNDGDLVTMLPAVTSRRGFPMPAGYQHVGVQIKLSPRAAPKVFYFSDEGMLSKVKRTAENLVNWVFVVPQILSALTVHGLHEYEKRLVGALNETDKDGLDRDLVRYYETKILNGKSQSGN